MEWIIEAETLGDFVDHERYTISSKPLIRCRDCANAIPAFDTDEGEPFLNCNHWGDKTEPGGYCYAAERREE